MSSGAALTTNPDIQLGNGWSLYHWNGLSWKWVLCRPDGLKVGFNDEIPKEDVDGARDWARKTVAQIGGSLEN